MLSLRLYNSVLIDSTFFEDISADAIATWRRSTRRMGGYWRGSFTLYGDPGRLAKFFYERLAAHLVERWGGHVTWEGLVYEMDLTIGGSTRRRSLDTLANYVSVSYVDTNGDLQTTSVAQNTSSMRWYGRREELLTLDKATQTRAEAHRDTYLKEHAWPTARPVGALMGDAQLVVTVCGYAFTANWRYQETSVEGGSDATHIITDLINVNCEYLRVGRIGDNAIAVSDGLIDTDRTYDAIAEITELGDTDGNPWRFYVDNDRRANYQIISTTPEYYLRGGKMYASAGGAQEITPWIVKPGVARDLTYPVSKWNYSGWLPDARDFYMEEVEAGPGGLVLKTDLFEESEILAAQTAYESSLMTTVPAGRGGKRHVWELLGYSKEQKLGMTNDEWQAIKRAAQKRKRETGHFK